MQFSINKKKGSKQMQCKSINKILFTFSDILSSAIRLCVYPIDFSIYAACPRAEENSRELSVSFENEIF